MSPSILIESALALIYPNLCQFCRKQRAVPAEGYVCKACANSGLEFIQPPFCACCGLPFEGDISTPFKCANCHDQEIYFRSARAAVRFTGLVKEAIHRYKYNHAAWFERFLARILVNHAAPVLHQTDWDFLVPIPLHWTKRLERSFNQAERLCRALSEATGIPVNKRLLRRTKRTSTQVRLSRKERAENVKRAFAVRNNGALNSARIVLIDDVLTTGATASACAKVLMDNGAAVVDVWTVARGGLQ